MKPSCSEVIYMQRVIYTMYRILSCALCYSTYGFDRYHTDLVMVTCYCHLKKYISDFLYNWMKQIKLGYLEQSRQSFKSTLTLMTVCGVLANG